MRTIQGHRPRFLTDRRDARDRAIAADDLAGDNPIEREILQLVDLPHAAAAQPLDRLEPVEYRKHPLMDW
jgi:hypothetical protein